MLSIGDCGIMLEPQLGMDMSQLVGTAQQAEELGFGYVFRSDHLLPTDGRRGIDSPECWTSLGVVAAATRRLKFGPMVSPVGFRNPALLARMACTLHSFSSGRLQLAVGAGWYESEYRAHGFDFPSFAVRRKQFAEALDVLLPLVRDGKVDFDGEYYSAHTDCLPRPSGEVNVIVGSKSKALVRLAGRRADEWNIFVSSAEFFAERKAILEASSVGRTVKISETGPFLIGRSEAELEANAKKLQVKFGQAGAPQDAIRRIRERNAPCGLVDDFVRQVEKKLDAGIQRFYFQTLVPENAEMVALLADTLKTRF